MQRWRWETGRFFPSCLGDLAALQWGCAAAEAGSWGGGGGGGCCFSGFSFFALFLVHFLHFHPSVLKPDFDLSLTQVEESGHFVSTVPRQVHIE